MKQTWNFNGKGYTRGELSELAKKGINPRTDSVEAKLAELEKPKKAKKAAKKTKKK